MLRRILPFILIFVLVMLDISVVPVFTVSRYVVPLTMLFIACTGFVLGRVFGMLIGMIGGLLTDILAAAPLGYMMAFCIAFGYFAGLLGYISDEARAQPEYSRFKAFFKRIRAAFVLMCAYELVTLGYQYYYTALFELRYLYDALLRALIFSVAASAMYYALLPILTGKRAERFVVGGKREVKKL